MAYLLERACTGGAPSALHRRHLNLRPERCIGRFSRREVITKRRGRPHSSLMGRVRQEEKRHEAERTGTIPVPPASRSASRAARAPARARPPAAASRARSRARAWRSTPTRAARCRSTAAAEARLQQAQPQGIRRRQPRAHPEVRRCRQARRHRRDRPRRRWSPPVSSAAVSTASAFSARASHRGAGPSTVTGASRSAVEAVEKAGGTLIVGTVRGRGRRENDTCRRPAAA